MSQRGPGHSTWQQAGVRVLVQGSARSDLTLQKGGGGMGGSPFCKGPGEQGGGRGRKRRGERECSGSPAHRGDITLSATGQSQDKHPAVPLVRGP